jgi:chemotaxis methyl-accepting protein methylase
MPVATGQTQSPWSYQPPTALSEQQIHGWLTLLEARTGISFARHQLILQTGLFQRMRESGVEDVDSYYRQVSSEPEGLAEWTRLLDRLTVKETRFFREPAALAAVHDYICTLLEDPADKKPSLALWSVGCSSGEEAYSLAMIADDAIDKSAADCYLAITATDISSDVLMTARRGRYSERKLTALPLRFKHRYMQQVSASEFQLVDSLCQRLCFTRGNVLNVADMPRQAMDVIYCQNVLIYFRSERQLQVLDALVEHLNPGGLLVLGSVEAAGWHHPAMKRSADVAVRAYKKQKVANYE